MNQQEIKRPRIMIAAPRSGSGKTLVVAALLRSLSAQGLRIRPYKVGPDYLDPTYHVAACGEASYNLDTWMMRPEFLERHFMQTSHGYHLSLVEGVMGLFDGKGSSFEGSSAEIAQVLDVPVLLVVDCSGLSGSIAPLVDGFVHFDPGVKVEGVILNNVAGESHLSCLLGALASCPVKVAGHVFRDTALSLPDRHLGLVTAPWGMDPGRLDRLSRQVSAHIDLDLILEIADRPIPDRLRAGGLSHVAAPPEERSSCCTIAVAWDEAFHFYYQANLDLLQDEGARIRFFSPLSDIHLPENTDAVYLGGGYPELHAARLSANRDMRGRIARFAAEGGPVYAECGGLIYLGRGLYGRNGRFFPLCGVLDLDFRMLTRRKRLGYAEVVFRTDTLLGPAGETARGHEFHYSELIEPAETGGIQPAYEVRTDGGRLEGFSRANLLASYIHLHFGSNPALAGHLVSRCPGSRTANSARAHAGESADTVRQEHGVDPHQGRPA